MQTEAPQHSTSSDAVGRPAIREVSGDVFELFPEALVDVVSCTGLKRSPYTQRLSRSYPSYYETYKRLCLRKKLSVGKPEPHDLGTLFGTRWVVALPTKTHWQEAVKPTQIKAALANLIDFSAAAGITTMALPLFDGPPEGWIQSKLLEESKRHPEAALQTVYLFRE